MQKEVVKRFCRPRNAHLLCMGSRTPVNEGTNVAVQSQRSCLVPEDFIREVISLKSLCWDFVF